MNHYPRGLVGALAVMLLMAGPANAGALIDDLARGSAAAGQPSSAPRPATRDQVPINEIQKAWDTSCARAEQVNPGIRKWRYSPTKTECLTIRNIGWTVFYFPEWERVERVMLADDSSFELYHDDAGKVVRPFPNVIMLRPRDGVVNADTTLHIFGQLIDGARNLYTAMVRSIPADSDKISDLTVYVEALRPGAGGGVVDFATVAPMHATAAPAAPSGGAHLGKGAPDYVRDVPFDMASMRFGEYEVMASNDDSVNIAPIRVFNDSQFTYLDFGEGGRADRILRPVVFRVVDGVDNPVNTRTTGPEGNILVVETVGYNLTVKNGDRVVCLLYHGDALKPLSAKAMKASKGGVMNGTAPAVAPPPLTHGPDQSSMAPNSLSPVPANLVVGNSANNSSAAAAAAAAAGSGPWTMGGEMESSSQGDTPPSVSFSTAGPGRVQNPLSAPLSEAASTVTTPSTVTLNGQTYQVVPDPSTGQLMAVVPADQAAALLGTAPTSVPSDRKLRQADRAGPPRVASLDVP
jgi:type IV secretory pathway VirB9-like protein